MVVKPNKTLNPISHRHRNVYWLLRIYGMVLVGEIAGDLVEMMGVSVVEGSFLHGFRGF